MSSSFADIARTWHPRWYVFQWVSKTPALRLLVHRDFMAHLQQKVIAPDAPFVKGHMEAFGFSEFEGSFEGNFGFDGTLQNQGLIPGGSFFSLLIPLPCVRIDTGVCDYCAGSGNRNNNSLGPACLYCDNTGRSSRIRYKEGGVYAVLATLSLLFMLMHPTRLRTSSDRPQLFTFNSALDLESGGCSLHGTYSFKVIEWLDIHRDQLLPDVIAAMKGVEGHMLGRKLAKDADAQFTAIVSSSGLLQMKCPGDRCRLSNYEPKHGEGYNFLIDNLENPVQLIEFLAAFAVLHKLVNTVT